MSDVWQRFLNAGEDLKKQPALFPSVVAFLEAIVENHGSREFILRFHESHLASLSPRRIAELLCQAEPRLTELENALDIAIERMPLGIRQQAAQWALATVRGHDQTLPHCVGQLLAMLNDPSEPDA